MEIELRDYQIDVYNKIKNEFKKGHQGVGACLACRSGKSYIFGKIAQDANRKGNNVLILVHRIQLKNQHKKLFDEYGINEKMTRIESVFTEANHLGEKGPVDLIIIDEAHLSGAKSYQKVCQYYGCKRILFTATFSRLDGKPLDLCEVIVKGITADELIKRGFVSPYKMYAPNLNIDFSDLKKNMGEYNNEQLGNKMSSKKIYGDVIKYYNLLAKDKQAICYTVNIKHSKETTAMFNNAGISAMHMDATTPEKEREQILTDFKNKKFKILCNCNLISEGITLEGADVALLLRKTASVSLYIQQACRCLTPVKGKEAIIIDFVRKCF